MKNLPILFSFCITSFIAAQSHMEIDGFVVLEAEDFSSQSLVDVRRWILFDENNRSHPYWDSDDVHLEGASGGAYLEILPDTRSHHGETLERGVNFSNVAGEMAVLSYPVHFENPGRYYVWARAYSTGTEDNGIHIGLNGSWPKSGQRLQLCEGKGQWTWSSQQRVPDNHCGIPFTIWLDIEEPGTHLISVSMREDGFELDKLLLSLDPEYTPEGSGPRATWYLPTELPKKEQFLQIKNYRYLWRAVSDFEVESNSNISFYVDQGRSALAINAAKEEYRDRFARAYVRYDSKGTREFDLQLVTLAETDGESEYRVFVNDSLVGSFVNPESDVDYREAYFRIEGLSLSEGDMISVESKAVTNGKIPEGSGTAYSRGRWIGLVLQ